MAGTCWGDGVGTDADGKLTILGPRAGAWPGGTGCPIGTGNALRVDADTGLLWVAPMSVSVARATQANRSIAPTAVGVVQLTAVALEVTAPACGPAVVRFDVTGGYAGCRAVTGNFWTIQRYLTVYIDGAPTAYTGLEPVGGIENDSGGVLATSGAVDPNVVHVPATAGQKVRLLAHYELNVQTFSANAVNGVAWRPPRIEGMIIGQPG